MFRWPSIVRRLPGQHERRRVRLEDDRGAVERVAARSRLSVVQRDRLPLVAEVGLTQLDDAPGFRHRGQ